MLINDDSKINEEAAANDAKAKGVNVGTAFSTGVVDAVMSGEIGKAASWIT